MTSCKNIDFLELSSEILSQGNCLRFRARGGSMYPFVRDGDILEVEPVNGREIRLGDVIFYQTADERVVAHRVVRQSFSNDGPILITRGDSTVGKGERVSLEDILGRVKFIERNGRKIRFDSGTGRLIGIFFAKLSPFSRWIYPPLRKIKHNLFRGKRKMVHHDLHHGVEDEYLVSLIANSGGKDDGQVEDGFDWEYILNEARRNGVSPILYLRLKNQKEDFPETFLRAEPQGEVFEKLEKDYYQSLRRNILMWEEIKPILKSFKEDGIEVILLKGVALAELVYKNLALRPMSDIDLLVKKEELPRIDERMRKFGYSTDENYRNSLRYSSVDYLNSIEYRNRAISVHFHWHLVNSTLPSFMYASKIDIEKIWKEAIPVKISGTETLSLAPHHLLIHLSEHASKPGHSLSKLILLYDIAETIKVYQEELDWELLINEARTFNLNRPLYYSLYLTSRLIGLENMPANILDELRPKNLGYGERRFLGVSRYAPTLWNKNCSGLSYLLHLAMCQGNFQKIRFIWQSFFPPSAVLRLRYPSQRNRLGFHLKRRLNQSLTIFFPLFPIFIGIPHSRDFAGSRYRGALHF
ncbi:MAG: nucleotidyltransferase family protein [Bacteroidales bacterium]|nr:nucleotidyltransferase family protein [Bacteroidales bacterium]